MSYKKIKMGSSIVTDVQGVIGGPIWHFKEKKELMYLTNFHVVAGKNIESYEYSKGKNKNGKYISTDYRLNFNLLFKDVYIDGYKEPIGYVFSYDIPFLGEGISDYPKNATEDHCDALIIRPYENVVYQQIEERNPDIFIYLGPYNIAKYNYPQIPRLMNGGKVHLKPNIHKEWNQRTIEKFPRFPFQEYNLTSKDIGMKITKISQRAIKKVGGTLPRQQITSYSKLELTPYRTNVAIPGTNMFMLFHEMYASFPYMNYAEANDRIKNLWDLQISGDSGSLAFTKEQPRKVCGLITAGNNAFWGFQGPNLVQGRLTKRSQEIYKNWSTPISKQKTIGQRFAEKKKYLESMTGKKLSKEDYKCSFLWD